MLPILTISGHTDPDYNGLYYSETIMWGQLAYVNCQGNWFYYRQEGYWPFDQKFYVFHHEKPLTNQ